MRLKCTARVCVFVNYHLCFWFNDVVSSVMKAMSDLGVTVILDERLDLSTVADSQKKGAERVVKTLKGREIAAELVVRYPLISPYHHAHDYHVPY